MNYLELVEARLRNLDCFAAAAQARTALATFRPYKSKSAPGFQADWRRGAKSLLGIPTGARVPDETLLALLAVVRDRGA
jgi:hypothetical protein